MPEAEKPSLLCSRGAALAAMLIAGVLAAVLLSDFLFGNKVLLFLDIGSDTYYHNYAFFHLLAEYVAGLRLPLWSFRIGAGDSILSLFHLLYDPAFWWFAVAGARNIPGLIAWIFLVKAMLGAGFAYAYLRQLRLSPQVALVAALLWAFNGFLMVWGQHSFLGSWVLFVPLFFLGVERCWQEGRWWLLVATTAFLVLSLFVFYQIAVFSLLYLLARCIGEVLSGDGRGCWRRAMWCCAAMALGVGLSTVLWLPEYHMLSTSPRVANDWLQRLQAWFSVWTQPNTSEYYRTVIARVFSNNLEGVGSAYGGFLNYYESPQLFVGLLPLLVIPQLWPVLPARQRGLALLGLSVATLAMAMPAFAMFMNGLQYASYRWGYGIIFMELVLAAIVLDRMLQTRRVSLVLLAVTVVVLATMLVWLQAAYRVPMALRYTALGILGAYAVLLVWWVRAQRRWIPLIVLLGLLGTELLVEHVPSFSARGVMHKNFEASGESHFFDDGMQAVQFLRERDHGFFRVEKNHWILSLNDAAVQGYFGVDVYNSLTNRAYMDAMQHYAASQRLTAVQWNSLNHPYLADALGVKYHLTKDSSKLPSDVVRIGRQGSVDIYERPSALPFGFTYDAYVPAPLLAQMSAPERERALLQAAIVEEPEDGRLKALERLAPPDADAGAREARRAEVLELSSMREDVLRGRIRLASDRLLFLAIPYERGWSARVNGEPVELLRVNVGFMGIHLAAGESLVELRYVPPLMRTGAVVSLLSLCAIIGLLWNGRRRKARLVGGAPQRGS